MSGPQKRRGNRPHQRAAGARPQATPLPPDGGAHGNGELAGLRALVDASTDLLFELELPSARILHANRTACDLLGPQRQGLEGTSLLKWIDDPWRAVVTRMLQGAQSDLPVTDTQTVELRAADGSRLAVELAARRIDGTRAAVCARNVAQCREMAEAVRASEARYRQFSSMTSDMLACFALAGDGHPVLEWSAGSYEQITGYTADELDRMGGLSAIMDPQDRERALRSKAEVEQGRAAFAEEYRITARDGSKRWVKVWGRAESDPGPARLVRVYHAAQDVTERKQAEEALRESETRYRTLFERARDAIFVTDTERFLECNRRALEIYGASREQLVGHSPWDFSPPKQPDGRDSREAAEARIGRAWRGEPQLFQWRHRRPDGSEFDAEVSLARIELAAGPLMLATVRDVTERTRAEEEIRNRHAELEQIFEAIPDAIVYADSQRRIMKVNSGFTRLFGYRPEEVLGRETRILYASDEAFEEQGRLRYNVRAREVYKPYEIDHRKKSGEVFTSETVGTPVRDAEDRVIGLLGIVRDVTERKRAADALRQQHALMDYIIRHDPNAVAVYDNDLRYVFVSERYKRDYNVGDRDILGKHHYEVFPEMPARWKEVHRRVLAGAIERSEDDCFDRSDGSVTYNRWECRPWYEADGRIGGMITYTEVTTERRLAEQALRESERALATLMGNLPGMAYRCLNDPQRTMLFLSEGCRDVTAFEPHDLAHNRLASYAQLIHPEDRERVWDEVRAAVAADRQYTLSYRIRTRRDEERFVLEKGRRVDCTEDGHRILEGFVADITDRQRAEEALRDSEQKLRDVVEGSPIPQFAIDADHRVVYWNRALEALSGIPAGQVVGTRRHWQAFYPQPRPCLADLLVEGDLDGLKRCYDEPPRESAHLDGAYHGVAFFPRTGRGGRWLRFSAAVLHDSRHRVVGAVETLEDVTERRRAAEALRESELRLSVLFEQAADAIFVCTLDGRLVQVNEQACRSTGYPEEELLHMGVTDVDVQASSPGGFAAMLEGLGSRGTTTVTSLHRRKDGSTFPVEVSIARLETPEGTRILGTARNITERVRAEEALRDATMREMEAVRAGNVGLWDWDLATDRVRYSAQWKRQIGYDDHEIGDGLDEWKTRVHGDDLPAALAAAQRCIAERSQDYHTEFRFRHKDGSYRWIMAQASVLQDDRGRAIRMRGSHVDITARKQAELSLQESEEKFRLLFERSADGHVIFTDRYLDCNRACLNMLRMTDRDQLIGCQPADISPEKQDDGCDSREKAEEMVARAYAEGSHRFEWVCRRADGERLELEILIHRISLKGEPAIHGVLRDITERKQAERALRESEAGLREAQRLARLGNWYWDVRSGAVEWSDEVYRIFQRDPREFTPRIDSIMALSPWPGDSQRHQELIQRAAETRERGTFEQRFLRPDGSVGHYFSTFQGVYDEQGSLEAIKGTVQDITERKRAEEELAPAQALLMAAIEESPAGIVIADAPDGRIRVANSASLAIRGLGGDSLTGIPADRHASHWQTFHPDGTPYAAEDLPLSRAVLRGETTRNVEVIIRRTDGANRYVLANGAPVRDSYGQVVAGIVVFPDVTDLKRAEQEIRQLNEDLERRVRLRTSQLEAANKELEAFAYSVSHDLRAPLRHMDAFAEMLQSRASASLDEKGLRYLKNIRDAALRMGMLIDDLLAFSRAGRVPMRSAPVALDALVQQVLKELEPEMRGRRIDWAIDPLPGVTGDRTLLRQVMANLLSNAVKFTAGRDPARIEVQGREDDEEVVVLVRDNGVGFDDKYAEKVFGLFQRLHGPDEFSGTGVGLSNVRRIVHRHGGRTWAEAQPGQGAAFYFSLPKRP